MRETKRKTSKRAPTVIIGAGIGGLAAAARLAQAGEEIVVLERHARPGGKMRTFATSAGPADAGPTVLTLRPVFEDLFTALGEDIDDHLTLVPQDILARHFWPDGSQLDLFADPVACAEAIADFAGRRAAAQFTEFSTRARRLFDAFDAPMMQSETPSLAALSAHVAKQPSIIPLMAPLKSLADTLSGTFDDPRLAQLFGRYATYVGGSPYRSPAILSLIWQAEAAGVWVVKGGMHRLAEVLETLATVRGAEFRYGVHVSEIEISGGDVRAVHLSDGARIAAGQVLFNGDPRALASGALGLACTPVARRTLKDARSLSAEVWAFAARAEGPALAHHNVFFRNDPKPEFDALMRGGRVADPTLYLCAQDRGGGGPAGPEERFEIIANAPPLSGQSDHEEEFSACQSRVFGTLERFGLVFAPRPGPEALTTPRGFDHLFPASLGSLYGQSPHGMLAGLRRPGARTRIGGLYLVGGGAHPGAGVPMATLSARHAVAAMLSDRISTSRSRQTATPGGISTESATAAPARSASSRS